MNEFYLFEFQCVVIFYENFFAKPLQFKIIVLYL